MRRHRIVYSETARADIIAIGDEIRNAAGELVAERFVARIIVRVLLGSRNITARLLSG